MALAVGWILAAFQLCLMYVQLIYMQIQSHHYQYNQMDATNHMNGINQMNPINVLIFNTSNTKSFLTLNYLNNPNTNTHPINNHMNINIQLQIQLQHPLIPIVVNKQNNHWIEWIIIINIKSQNICVGVSCKLDTNNNGWSVQAIGLNC
eukprot:415087_1